MKINDQLDKIFLEIIERYKGIPNSNGLPIKDGLINESVFENQANKILFVCKEHNTLDLDYSGSHLDARIWMSESVNYNFSNRIAEWSFGILKNFPPFEESQNEATKLQYLNSVAFLNLKKYSGTSVTNNKVIGEYIHASKDLLKKQIDVINPDIIIFCTDWVGFIEWILEIKMSEKIHGVEYGLYGMAKVINFGHPSSRGPKESLYYWLKEVINFKFPK